MARKQPAPVEESPPPAKRGKKVLPAKLTLTPRAAEMQEMLAEVNKIVKISNISLSAEDRLSTGLLCMDLVYGGGLAPGFHICYGAEQSSKTTLTITMMGASVNQNVDLRVLWDAENSTGSSTDYVTNIFNTGGVKATVEEIFQGDESTGQVPLVVYRDDCSGDKFFDYVAAIERRLPDKRYEDGKWWYVYSDQDKKAVARYKDVCNKKLSQQNPGVWVEAPDGRPQAIILIDSFPSLVPTKMDEDDHGDNSLAVQARMYAKHLPRIKGYLRQKRIIILGINQLRLNPMARFGSPETEPCGQALKFNSDTRMRMAARALSGAPYNPKGEGQIEKEMSVSEDGGEDVYRYICVKAVKNKLSVPGRETWLRLWTSDGNGEARGYDPAFDTFHYLYLTGQVSGKRSLMKLNLTGLGEATKALKWLEFKMLILGNAVQKKAILEKIGYPAKADIRKGCFKQIVSGKGEQMYLDTLTKKRKATDDDDEAPSAE